MEADAHPLPDGRSRSNSGGHVAGCLPHGYAADSLAQVSSLQGNWVKVSTSASRGNDGASTLPT